jgi:hypothetical protein
MLTKEELLEYLPQECITTPDFCYIGDTFYWTAIQPSEEKKLPIVRIIALGHIIDIDWVDPTELIQRRILIKYLNLVTFPPQIQAFNIQIPHLLLGTWEKDGYTHKLIPLREFLPKIEEEEIKPQTEEPKGKVLQFPIRKK